MASRSIETVTILGAGGRMGSLTGGLAAQNGLKVFFLSRTVENAKRGLKRAINQARSEYISKNIFCASYDDYLDNAIHQTDWIIECVSEDIEVKKEMYKKIDVLRQPDTVISTMSSSLPLRELCKECSEGFKRNFLGVHFYNPPSKLLACELASTPQTDPTLIPFMEYFLSKKLNREIIKTFDVPAYIGNRVAFVFLAALTKLAEESNVETIDYLFGPFTGRAMPPLATLDLVGLDIHQAIIMTLKNVVKDFAGEFLTIPAYLQNLITKGCLGNKTPDKGGFYRKDALGNRLSLQIKDLSYRSIKMPRFPFIEAVIAKIRIGKYREAFDYLLSVEQPEADIIRKMLALYISYSYSCIGKISDLKEGIKPIDRVMGFGFNWAPPSVLVNIMGGPNTIKDVMTRYSIPVPSTLINDNMPVSDIAHWGRFFIAK